MQRPQKDRFQDWIGPEAPSLHLCQALCHVLLYGCQNSLVAAKWLGQPNTLQHIFNIQKREFLQVVLC